MLAKVYHFEGEMRVAESALRAAWKNSGTSTSSWNIANIEEARNPTSASKIHQQIRDSGPPEIRQCCDQLLRKNCLIWQPFFADGIPDELLLKNSSSNKPAKLELGMYKMLGKIETVEF